MGCKMCKKTELDKLNQLAPNEPELKFPTYSSSGDSFLQIIEQKYNLLTFVQLIEYLNFLEQFSVENATVPFSKVSLNTKFSGKDAFLSVPIAPEEFQSFIENRILKVEEIEAMTDKNVEIVSTFKDVFLEIYKGLQLKFNQHFNDEAFIIKKINILAMGLLFCGANNVSKCKLFFDLFTNDNNEFESSDLLNEFLMTLFLVSSYCMVSARKKASSKNSNIEKLTNDELVGLVNVSELKDNQNLLEVFNKGFFGEKKSYNWEDFKKKFNEDKDTSYGWIFNTQGIRSKLEENNK